MARLDRTSIERVMTISVGGTFLDLVSAPRAVPPAPRAIPGLGEHVLLCPLCPAQPLLRPAQVTIHRID
ncbi:hypothetical protein A2U01_0091676 [Trifolium medium]|uniref:Uncharacterized protein n=1 Tax=Trifolium medium TaxID=97028 RepID=A0A392UA71_9FABA|nr:hypothetical protein [Trifolium medium]